MIISTLYGGLGNQMLIYAMVRALAYNNNTTFAFDINSGFKRDFLYNRRLALDGFNVTIKEAQFLSFNFPFGRYFRRISKWVGWNILAPHYSFITEKRPLYFESDLFVKRISNAYLCGYWHSYRYFEKIEGILRNDFTFKKNFSKDVYNEAEDILVNKSKAIALGIRRYQECKENVVDVLDASYYNKAMEIFSNRIENPIFYVFTQEPDWAKSNLDKKFTIKFISKKEGDDRAIDDMYLMSLFNKYIISNSTFYWWGAWLSKDSDKTVITPSNWVNRDCVPSSWIKIE